MDILEMHEGEWVRIKRRLQSSRSSGNYWDMVPVFGVNNAPYEPLLSIRSRRFYLIKVEPQLQHLLTLSRIETQSRQLKVIVPTTRISEISEFLKRFEKPVQIIIGHCAVNLEDFEELGIKYVRNRVKEMLIFDRTQSEWDWIIRKKLLERMKTRMLEEFSETQGHLKVSHIMIYDFLPERVKKRMERRQGLTMFNHAIKFFDNTGYPSRIYALRSDNEAIVINDLKPYVRYEIVSYDHQGIWGTLTPGEGLLLSHPFPVGNDVD